MEDLARLVQAELDAYEKGALNKKRMKDELLELIKKKENWVGKGGI